MTVRSKLRSSRRVAAAVAFGSLIAASSSLAQAQATLSASQVEHIIETSGYEVLGPVVRHGSTYVADVVGEGDISEQFVIDARDGRLLHRYRTNSAVRRRDPWPNPSTGLTGFFDTLFGGADVTPLPPPPADEFSDKPRPKAHTRRPVSAAAPAAQQIKTPSPAATASPAAPAAAAPAPEAHQPESAANPAPVASGPSAATTKTSSPKANDVQVAPLE